MADVRITYIHGGSDDWAASTLILGAAQPGMNTDTGEVKIGNGNDLWSVLPVAYNAFGSSVGAVIDDSPANGGQPRSDATLSSQAIVSLINAAVQSANGYTDSKAIGGPKWVPAYQNADGTWPNTTAGARDGTIWSGTVNVGTAPPADLTKDIVFLRDPS